MKTRYSILISAFILLTTAASAQDLDYRAYRDEGNTTIVNNYYTDNDYYYSSRIRRFHNSFSTFSYYSPVYTDVYWYSYKPFTWGLSIYGGYDPVLAFSYNFPFFSYGFSYRGWYDNYYSDVWDYYSYDPWFVSYRYSPVIISINLGNRWGRNYYDWNHHNHRFYSNRSHYRDVNIYNYNYYNSSPGYTYNEFRPSERRNSTYSPAVVNESGRRDNRSYSAAPRREPVERSSAQESGRRAGNGDAERSSAAVSNRSSSSVSSAGERQERTEVRRDVSSAGSRRTEVRESEQGNRQNNSVNRESNQAPSNRQVIERERRTMPSENQTVNRRSDAGNSQSRTQAGENRQVMENRQVNREVQAQPRVERRSSSDNNSGRSASPSGSQARRQESRPSQPSVSRSSRSSESSGRSSENNSRRR